MAQSDERINKELLLARIQELEKAVATLRADLEGNRKPSNSGAAQTPLPVSTERNSVNLSAFSLSHPAVSRLYSPKQLTADSAFKRLSAQYAPGDVMEINVGGVVYTTTRQTLQSYPESMLGVMFSGRFAVTKDKKGRPFIDRPGRPFAYVLNVLRGLPLDLPSDSLLRREVAREFEYYGLPTPPSLLPDMFMREDVDIVCVRTLTAHLSSVMCLEVVDDRWLISGSADRTVRVWDLQTDECVRVLEGHSDGVECLSAAGEFIASGARDCLIKLWSRLTGEAIQVFCGHKGVVMCVQLSLCGSGQLVSGSEDKTIRVWDVKTGECNRVLDAEEWIYAMQLRGTLLVVGRGGSSAEAIQIWDLSTGQKERTLPAPAGVTSLYLGPDNILFAGLKNAQVCSHRLAPSAPEVCPSFSGHSGIVWAVQQINNILVSASVDRSIRLWDLPTGRCLRVLTNHSGTVNCVRIVGNFIISGSVDKPSLNCADDTNLAGVAKGM